MTQTRWVCRDCHREWVYRTAAAGPEANCFACGSQQLERVTFQGLFDSTTPRDVTVAAEETAPATLTGLETMVTPPPLTLAHAAPEADEDRLVGSFE